MATRIPAALRKYLAALGSKGGKKAAQSLTATQRSAEGVKQFRVVTHGNAWSIYFPDPEGNRIELFVDTPWHTPQPVAEPFDIEAPVETIFKETEALCRNRPGFASRAEWRKSQVARMGG